LIQPRPIYSYVNIIIIIIINFLPRRFAKAFVCHRVSLKQHSRQVEVPPHWQSLVDFL
jgi:hypothetical protein